MKISLMKLWVKSKTHKFLKTKLKSNLVKGSLLLLLASFLIFLTYQECMQDRNNTLISYTDTSDKIFDYLTINETLEIMKDKTGIIVFVNDKKTTNRFIDLLYNKELKENIYVCNVKKEEIVLTLNDENEAIIKQKPSQDYNDLLDRLGAYSETYYLLDDEYNIIETNYKRIITPMVLFVKNGKILFSHFIHDEETTDEELLEIYSKGFSLLKD